MNINDPIEMKRMFRLCAAVEVHSQGEACSCKTERHFIALTEPDDSADLAPITADGKKRAAQTGRTVQTWRAA